MTLYKTHRIKNKNLYPTISIESTTHRHWDWEYKLKNSIRLLRPQSITYLCLDTESLFIFQYSTRYFYSGYIKWFRLPTIGMRWNAIFFSPHSISTFFSFEKKERKFCYVASVSRFPCVCVQVNKLNDENQATATKIEERKKKPMYLKYK